MITNDTNLEEETERLRRRLQAADARADTPTVEYKLTVEPGRGVQAPMVLATLCFGDHVRTWSWQRGAHAPRPEANPAVWRAYARHHIPADQLPGLNLLAKTAALFHGGCEITWTGPSLGCAP